MVREDIEQDYSIIKKNKRRSKKEPRRERKGQDDIRNNEGEIAAKDKDKAKWRKNFDKIVKKHEAISASFEALEEEAKEEFQAELADLNKHADEFEKFSDIPENKKEYNKLKKLIKDHEIKIKILLKKIRKKNEEMDVSGEEISNKVEGVELDVESDIVSDVEPEPDVESDKVKSVVEEKKDIMNILRKGDIELAKLTKRLGDFGEEYKEEFEKEQEELKISFNKITDDKKYFDSSDKQAHEEFKKELADIDKKQKELIQKIKEKLEVLEVEPAEPEPAEPDLSLEEPDWLPEELESSPVEPEPEPNQVERINSLIEETNTIARQERNAMPDLVSTFLAFNEPDEDLQKEIDNMKEKFEDIVGLDSEVDFEKLTLSGKEEYLKGFKETLKEYANKQVELNEKISKKNEELATKDQSKVPDTEDTEVADSKDLEQSAEPKLEVIANVPPEKKSFLSKVKAFFSRKKKVDSDSPEKDPSQLEIVNALTIEVNDTADQFNDKFNIMSGLISTFDIFNEPDKDLKKEIDDIRKKHREIVEFEREDNETYKDLSLPDKEKSLKEYKQTLEECTNKQLELNEKISKKNEELVAKDQSKIPDTEDGKDADSKDLKQSAEPKPKVTADVLSGKTDKRKFANIAIKTVYNTAASIFGIKTLTDIVLAIGGKGDIHQALTERLGKRGIIKKMEEFELAKEKVKEVKESKAEKDKKMESIKVMMDIYQDIKDKMIELKKSGSLSETQEKEFLQKLKMVSLKQKEHKEKLEKKLEIDVKSVVDAYVENKVSGIKIIKDALNTGLLLTGFGALRTFAYTGSSIAEWGQKVLQKQSREKVLNNKIDVTYKKELWNTIKEHGNNLIFQSGDTKFQKTANFAKTIGLVTRGLGIYHGAEFINGSGPDQMFHNFIKSVEQNGIGATVRVNFLEKNAVARFSRLFEGDDSSVDLDVMIKDELSKAEALALLKHWSGGIDASSFSDLSDDKLREIREKIGDTKWLDAEMQKAGISNVEADVAQVDFDQMPKFDLELNNPVLVKLIGKDNLNDIAKHVYATNPGLNNQDFVTLFGNKIDELHEAAVDVAGKDPDGMEDLHKIIQEELNNDGNIDAAIDKVNQTVGYHEGISHSIVRQLEADPTKFGFQGTSDQLHSWASSTAGNIVTDEGFYDKTSQTWVKNAYEGSIRLDFDESTSKFNVTDNIGADNKLVVDRFIETDTPETNPDIKPASEIVVEHNYSPESGTSYGDKAINDQFEYVYETNPRFKTIDDVEYVIKDYLFKNDYNNNGIMDEGELDMFSIVYDKDSGDYIGRQCTNNPNHIHDLRGVDWRYPGVPESMETTDTVNNTINLNENVPEGNSEVELNNELITGSEVVSTSNEIHHTDRFGLKQWEKLYVFTDGKRMVGIYDHQTGDIKGFYDASSKIIKDGAPKDGWPEGVKTNIHDEINDKVYSKVNSLAETEDIKPSLTSEYDISSGRGKGKIIFNKNESGVVTGYKIEGSLAGERESDIIEEYTGKKLGVYGLKNETSSDASNLRVTGEIMLISQSDLVYDSLSDKNTPEGRFISNTLKNNMRSLAKTLDIPMGELFTAEKLRLVGLDSEITSATLEQEENIQIEQVRQEVERTSGRMEEAQEEVEQERVKGRFVERKQEMIDDKSSTRLPKK